MVRYGLFREVILPFDTVIKKLPQELRRKGFEILSNIRVDQELRKHLGVEYHRYTILAVCNLPIAYRALTREENFGLVMSSNIIIYEKDNYTMVGFLRPTQVMPLLHNEFISEEAASIERKLGEVFESLGKKRFLREKHKELQFPIDLERAVA